MLFNLENPSSTQTSFHDVLVCKPHGTIKEAALSMIKQIAYGSCQNENPFDQEMFCRGTVKIFENALVNPLSPDEWESEGIRTLHKHRLPAMVIPLKDIPNAIQIRLAMYVGQEFYFLPNIMELQVMFKGSNKWSSIPVKFTTVVSTYNLLK